MKDSDYNEIERGSPKKGHQWNGGSVKGSDTLIGGKTWV
jgi:hypothetical protein